MSNYVKILTNVPEIITFKFDSFKEWNNVSKKNGKAYKSYSIATENRGVDAYFSIFEDEYRDVFQPLEPLKDRTLEVLKYEDGKYKAWKIMEHGIDITPRNEDKPEPQATAQPTTQTTCNCDERFENMKTAFGLLKGKVESLEALVALVAGDDATKLHSSVPPKAKIETVPWTERLATEHQGDNMSPSA